jgi:DNA mismatch endonuclease (patch repair protein)
MARVRKRDTEPELILRRALHARGFLGYRCNFRAVPGTPDIAFTRYRVAVFVDGGFWHGHPTRWTAGRYGDYWDRKIERNMERDRKVDRELGGLGWRVVRLWDFEIKRDMSAAVEAVEAALVEGGRLLR